jgi:hypothetical protein
MALDLSALRAKLGELTNKTRREDVLWKPTAGENVVRIVPLKGDNSNPFIELYFHYLGRKTYLSPISFGDRDPIAEFAENLRSSGGLSKEEWAKTKDFVPKMRTFVPIVVRGKESEGVRFWAFGKTVYTELLNIIADPDYGDITDPTEGNDIKVSFIPQEKSSTGFPQTTIRISPKKTPLTTDKTLLKQLLEVQPDIFDVYPKQTFDELAKVLEKYLDPSANSETPSAPTRVASPAKAEEDEWADSPKSVTAEKSEKAPAAASKAAKVAEDFDALFES